MIIIFLLLQFVLNMTWHAGINPLRNNSYAADLSCGTYGNTASTAYITLAAIVGGACFWVSSKNLGKRFLAIILIILACIQFVFTFTIHAYLLIPAAGLVFVFLYPRPKGYGPGKAIYFLLALSIAFLTLVPMLSRTLPRQRYRHSVKYSQEYGKRAWRSVWDGPKVNVIRRVLKTAGPLQLAIDMGPNSGVSYTGMLLNSPQTIRLIGDWYYTASGRRELSTGSIRESLFSGIAMLISEIGIIGLILYLTLLSYPIFYIIRHVQYDKSISPEMRFLIAFVAMMFITNLAIGIVWDIWRVRMLTTGIWLLFGRIIDPEGQEDTSDATDTTDDSVNIMPPIPDKL
jgi:hypothetical protein